MTPKYLDALAELGGGHDTIDDVIARLDVGLFVDHVEEGCIYASPEVLRMFEMSWEEFRGFGWAKAVLPADVERLRTAIERYEIEKDTIEVEYSIRVADGSVRTIHVFGNAVLDREGRQLGSVMIGREVTAERAVLDRASQQQKLEVIGRLAGRVAHDFNNVLVPIMCSASLLKSEALSSSGREMLDTLEASAQHAAAITRQLLSLSRQTVHEHQLTVVDVELAEKTRLLRQLVGEQIALDVVLECGFAEVSLAPHELSQVVLNLVVNARDVSKPGDTVRVETWLDEGVAGIRVRDRGPGIPEAMRERIFEPFFTTKGADRGTGLGLFTVKELVEQAGGTIAVASTPGEGTEIEVLLPAVTTSSTQSTAVRGEVEVPPQRVLLVDDNAALRQTLAYVLALRGHDVKTSAGIGRALELLGRETFDVLVSDVLLQDGNGAELVKHARTLQADLKVVYISGFAGESLDAAELERPDTVFLEKPFHPNRLGRAMAEVLGLTRREGGAGAESSTG